VTVDERDVREIEADRCVRVERVSNTAGITGGIRLWDRYDGPISRRPASAGTPAMS